MWRSGYFGVKVARRQPVRLLVGAFVAERLAAAWRVSVEHPEEAKVRKPRLDWVAEGSGEIVLDGKVTQCSAGSIMFCKANVLHGIENTGKSPLLFYYVKWKCA